MSARLYPVADCDNCGETHTAREHIHAALTEYPQHIEVLRGYSNIHIRAVDLALIGRCLFGQLYASIADLTNAQITATAIPADAQFITAVHLEHQPGYDLDWSGGTFNRDQIAADLANARIEDPDADWRILQITDVTDKLPAAPKANAA